MDHGTSKRERVWKKVVDTIEELAVNECYEKVNFYMSLGTVNRLRKKTIQLLEGSKRILDAGCGPGTSSSLIAKIFDNITLILLDPSFRMLTIAEQEVYKSNPKIDLRLIVGRFERIPLRNNSVDGITAMFSFRDAVDFEETVAEFSRILTDKGRLAILDIYRPKNPSFNLVKLYFRTIVPFAVIMARCKGKLQSYNSFIETIKLMLTKEEIEVLLKKYFNNIKTYRVVPGLAIFYAEHPKI